MNPDPVAALLVGVGALALLFAAIRYAIPRWRELQRQRQRVRVEDALKHILNGETSARGFSAFSLAGALEVSGDEAASLMIEMQERGLIHAEHDTIRLTGSGRQLALHILRAHRLWERHLADETGIDELDWHLEADRLEHELTPEQTEQLAARLGNPTHDPHGDPIPASDGQAMPHGGVPLMSARVGDEHRIVHIEDEPQAVYAQLVAEGLRPGMELQITDRSPERIRFWSGGEEHVLAPVIADNVTVDQIVEGARDELRLNELQPNEAAEVVRLAPGCRGLERRRLLDLGFLRGAEIQAELTGSGGDPVAYRIRGALIALRMEQARDVLVRRVEPTA